MKEIYFYDKCFWCLENFFSYIEGVVETEVGYANGNTNNPSYYEVGDGHTGHEEVCKVCYDETIVSLESLLESFFKKLNPRKVYTEEEKTLRENQSAVIYNNDADLETILRIKQQIENTFQNELLTKVEPLKYYYKAEEEHQHYFKKHPEEAVCKL